MSSQHYQNDADYVYAGTPPPQDASRTRPGATPPIQTQNLRQNPRFSWQQTPVQPQTERFSREIYSSPTTTIQESPMSAHPTSGSIPMMLYPDEKAPTPAPPEMHPAHFAPYVDAVQQQAQPYHPQPQAQPQYQQPAYSPREQQPYSPHGQQPQSLHYHQKQQQQQPLPLPIPRHVSAPIKPQSPVHSPQHNPQLLTHFPAPPIPPSTDDKDHKQPSTPRTPTYNPNSPFGPNASTHTANPAPAAHMPGQIPHPNASSAPAWSTSLYSPDSTCLHGCFSPCTLYSLTSFRLSQKSSHKDPTNTLGHSTCDANAWLYALSCGLCGILACVQRGRVRRGYNIEGGVGGDCINGICCSCCALAQDEREVKAREEGKRRNEGPTIGYQPTTGMTYSAPPKAGH